jgi:hypothetical protein
VSYQTYTVKSGDSLSKIAKALGISGGWQALYNYNKSVIGSNPNLIYAGQTYNIPGTYQAPAPAPVAAPAPVVDPVIQQVQEIQKYKPTRETFESKIGGTESQFMAGTTPRLQQIAAEHINPEAIRTATRAIRQASMGAGGGMAETSGYGQSQGRELMSALERSRKEEMDSWVKQQQALVSDWYGKQYSGYQLAEDPNWLASMGGLESVMGTGWKPTNKAGTYQGIDLTNIFGGMGGNYGQLPTNLYGSIQY